MSIANGMGSFMAVLMVLAIIALVIFMPWVLVWSVNTLFGMAIPYTIKTYFAALVLGGLFSAKVSISK
jgi:hypothetical protein